MPGFAHCSGDHTRAAAGVGDIQIVENGHEAVCGKAHTLLRDILLRKSIPCDLIQTSMSDGYLVCA